VVELTEELDEDFYWTISRLKNFEPNNLTLWVEILKKYDGQNWSGSRTAVMKDLLDARYTNVKDLQVADEELLDKRFQSHVSFMFALGLGYENQDGLFVLSPIARTYLNRKNTEDFMIQQMVRWQMPNGSIRVKEKLQKWLDDSRSVIPFVLTMKTLLRLYSQSEIEAYLTNEEIVKILMPLKTHLTNVDEQVRLIVEGRKAGHSIRLSEREQERAREDLKILLSYFEATGLCYVPKSLIGNIGGKAVQLSDVLVLRRDKAEFAKRLISREYAPFDFSKFNLANQFQEAKIGWFQYYGSVPDDWRVDMTVTSVALEGDTDLPIPSKEEIDSAIVEIRKELMIEDNVVRQIVANLVAGRHVLLVGPIATGKTHLATLISQLIWKNHNNGYYSEMTTATSEWTTQDVIGGIYPKLDENGSVIYTVQRGCVTDTVWQNWSETGTVLQRSKHNHGGVEYRGVWLIVDEFNRANIDKAFGELFTALEYKALKYPTSKDNRRTEEVPIPKDYRIIATLNTFDKHFLFKLSDALKRRFAYIELLPPSKEKSEEEKYYVITRSLKDLPVVPEIAKKIELDPQTHTIRRGTSDKAFLKILDSAHDMFSFIRLTKNMGTGILNSMFRLVFVDNLMGADLDSSLDNAFISNVIPQLENLPTWSLESIQAFCCGSMIDLFREKKPVQADFINYQREFERLLDFLRIEKSVKVAEQYRKDEIAEGDWGKYDPWAGKARPKLPFFQQSLEDLIRESETL